MITFPSNINVSNIIPDGGNDDDESRGCEYVGNFGNFPLPSTPILEDNVVPPYSPYSQNSTAKGTVVYVNYGQLEDYEELLELESIGGELYFQDKIVLARYFFNYNLTDINNDKGVVSKHTTQTQYITFKIWKDCT